MSNNQENHKENHERFHLKIFSSLKRLPGKELPRLNASQKPDFLFQRSETIFGIEHTEIKKVRSSKDIPSLAELKGIHRGIVTKAGQLAAEQGLPPLNVQVNFHDHYYRFKQKGERAVLGLLDTVKKNLDRIMNAESFDTITIDPPDPFVGISLVHVTPGTANGKVWLNHHRWEVMEPEMHMEGQIFILDNPGRSQALPAPCEDIYTN